MELRQITDTYYEKLLVLQYEVTDAIEHRLTKGEVREALLEQLIRGDLKNINIENGILACGDWQSTQADCVVLKKNARIGINHMYDAADCSLFMEIKSYATKSEYRQLQEHAKEIKMKNPEIIVGMFSYSSAAKRETVIPQFGFKHDKGLDTFESYSKTIDKYPDIDFYYNLDIEEKYDSSDNIIRTAMPYCIVKDGEGVKSLFLRPPVISNLINVFRGTIE